MATKTVTLSGDEIKVDGLGGYHATVFNNSEDVLYASGRPGVEPYADDVFEIRAGERANVLNTNGVVYLLGNNGRAECTGTVGNFSLPSSVSESGGGGVTLAEVNSIVAEQIAEVVANAPEDLDTLKEISDWIEGHEDSAAAMNSAIQTNAADISELSTEQETQNSNISTLQTEMKQKADISEVSNPNLLDNWYFLNPVNQRGKTEYSGAWNANANSIDRWNIYSGHLSVTNQGLTRTDNGTTSVNFRQYMEPSLYNYLHGKQVTVSILTNDGRLASATYIPNVLVDPYQPSGAKISNDDGTSIIAVSLYRWSSNHSGRLCVSIGISTSDVAVVAAKLEMGNKQTLAIQDSDGKWILNDPPPNFGTELLKCQRYYQRIGGNKKIIGSGFLLSSTPTGNTLGASLMIPLMAPMRADPTVKLVGTLYVSADKYNGTASIPTTGIINYGYTSNAFGLSVRADMPSDCDSSVLAAFRDDDSYLELSADL